VAAPGNAVVGAAAAPPASDPAPPAAAHPDSRPGSLYLAPDGVLHTDLSVDDLRRALERGDGAVWVDVDTAYATSAHCWARSSACTRSRWRTRSTRTAG
jgi:hypothetical protein